VDGFSAGTGLYGADVGAPPAFMPSYSLSVTGPTGANPSADDAGAYDYGFAPFDLPAFPDDFYECFDEVVVVDDPDDLDIDDPDDDTTDLVDALKAANKARMAPALARML
jgi:hypothetical protein